MVPVGDKLSHWLLAPPGRHSLPAVTVTLMHSPWSTPPRVALLCAAWFVSSFAAVSAVRAISVGFTGGNFTVPSGSPQAFYSSSGVYFTDAVPNTTTAFAGGSLVGTQYIFGFLGTSSPTGVPADYDLSAKDLVNGTSLTLNFQLVARPKFVAYTGGSLTSYSYNSSSRVLTITASTTNPVGSASDTTGNTLGSAFGLMIETGASAPDYLGAVFRTDMYWRDLGSMVTGGSYTGDSPLAGLNASGVNGTAATFYAYLPTAFLNTIGLSDVNSIGAIVQKASGVSYGIDVTKLSVAAGSSALDFDGGGADSYVLASYSNSSWSAGNIGIVAVPEPATYAAWLGSFALFAVWRRKTRGVS